MNPAARATQFAADRESPDATVSSQGGDLPDLPVHNVNETDPDEKELGVIDFDALEPGIHVPRTNNILVVDDEPHTARFEAEIMRELGFRAFEAHDANQAYELAAAHNPDLVLLDFMLPHVSGLEILRHLKVNHPQSYVIVVTGKGSEEVAIELMRAGASDYIIKPIPGLPVFQQIIERNLRLREAELQAQLYVEQLKRLNTILKRKMREKTDDLRRTNLILKRLVVRDHLTGLYNQRALYTQLEKEVARANRYRRQLGFIMFDLDFFKRVNDSRGHQAGSAILMKIARLITECIRKVDWAARFGGDEFSVVLPETDPEGARIAAERIRRRIESYDFRLGSSSLRLTASFGVSIFEPGTTTSSIIKKADDALYQAKARGRNRVEVSFEDLQDNSAS